MIQLKIKHRGSSYTIYHALKKHEELAELEQNLILQGEIPELQPVEIKKGFWGTKLEFDIENCITVEEYLGNGISLHEFCYVMLDIIEIILKCESHGISICNLELRTEFIFYNTVQHKVVMLYWPVNSVKEYPDVRGMFNILAGSFYCCEAEQKKFYELLAMINKREKVNLLEWKKEFSKCCGKIEHPITGRIFLKHMDNGKQIEIHTFPFLVGRQLGACDYAVQDGLVSRRHFSIWREGSTVYIRDDNTANGTRVNGQVLAANEKRKLQNNSLIEIGNQKFYFYQR